MCDVGKRSSMNKYWSALWKSRRHGQSCQPCFQMGSRAKGRKVSWNPKEKDFPAEKYKATSFMLQQHPNLNSEKEQEERHEQAENSLTPQEKCAL